MREKGQTVALASSRWARLAAGPCPPTQNFQFLLPASVFKVFIASHRTRVRLVRKEAFWLRGL